MLTHVLQPQHSGAVVPFVDMSALVQTYFIRSRYYDGAEKALFPNKCFIITIASSLFACFSPLFIISFIRMCPMYKKNQLSRPRFPMEP